MIDIKQQNTTPITADPTPLLVEEAEVRAIDPKVPKHEKSGGEKLFNRVVYTGIGFGVNEGSTLVIADEFEHGIGKNLYNKVSDWMVKAFKYKDIIKNGELIPAKKSAANMLLYATLLTSGTLLLWPMKMLEENKGKLVQKANHWLDGNKLTPEEVATRDKQVEEDLACQPKQTWPSLIVGRIAAIGAVMGLGKLMGPKNTENLMAGSERLFTGSIAKQKNRLHRYTALLGLETLTCGTSSFTLEVISKLFGKAIGGVTVRDPELCTQLVHEKPDTASAPVSSSSGNTTTDTDVKELVNCAPCALEALKSKAIAKANSHVDALENQPTFGLSV